MKKFQIRLITTGVAALLLALMIPSFVAAQDHVVKSGDLHQALVNASRQRMDNINKVESFLASEVAQQALKSVGIKPGKINQAVSLLADEELAQLASRAAEIQADFTAGAEISDRTMLYIIPIAAVGSVIALLLVMP